MFKYSHSESNIRNWSGGTPKKQINQITIDKNENEYRICGYENEIISKIWNPTECQVDVNRFINEKEMTTAPVMTSRYLIQFLFKLHLIF